MSGCLDLVGRRLDGFHESLRRRQDDRERRLDDLRAEVGLAQDLDRPSRWLDLERAYRWEAGPAKDRGRLLRNLAGFGIDAVLAHKHEVRVLPLAEAGEYAGGHQAVRTGERRIGDVDAPVGAGCVGGQQDLARLRRSHGGDHDLGTVLRLQPAGQRQRPLVERVDEGDDALAHEAPRLRVEPESGDVGNLLYADEYLHGAITPPLARRPGGCDPGSVSFPNSGPNRALRTRL